MKKSVVASFTSLALIPWLFAAEPEVTPKKSGPSFDAGFDLRFRYEYKDNWMDKGKTSIDTSYEDYARLRTRVWGKADFTEDLGAYLRLGNEFRDYRNSTRNKHRNEFPDEVYIDNLYFDVKNIQDVVDLRLGRQNIKQGEGRMFHDGTAGDGSRSEYYDAILAKVKMLEKSDIDLIGIWQRYRDDWTIGNPHDVYDLTKIKSGSPYSKMEEKALAAYMHYNEVENFPMEFYWIWKQETRFYDKKTRYPGRDFHTIGLRLVPRISDTLSAELESAFQLGEIDSQRGDVELKSRDIVAWMTYAGVTYKRSDWFAKPRLTGAVLYLSGDEDHYYKTANGGTDNGWNPVFNRCDSKGHISAGMYDSYRWSNLIYPHAELAVEPYAKHKIRLQAGPMYAAEKDNNARDSYRGLFTLARYDFPLLSKMFGKRGELKGAVVGELLAYGDYYEHEAADTDVATWLRIEINGKF
jgi:hypothetical protein